MMYRQLHTSGAVGGSGDQAYRLFQQHSLHWEDLVCWQIQATLHLAAHPATRNQHKLLQHCLNV